MNKNESRDFLKQISQHLTSGVNRSSARFIAQQLGAHTDGNTTRFLIRHLEIAQAEKVFLKLYIPLQHILFDEPNQSVCFLYREFEIIAAGEYGGAVMEGLPAGDRERFGAFYEFQLQFKDGSRKTVRDPMAWSMPYGIYAPAEVYNVDKVRWERKDKEYFKQLGNELEKSEERRIGPSVNLLEVHTATATKGGTLQSLKERYKQIGRKIKNGDQLTPDEKNFAGFDAIELMPIEPVIEHPVKHRFWDPVHNHGEGDEDGEEYEKHEGERKAVGDEDGEEYQKHEGERKVVGDADGREVTIRLKKPSVINWGYDIAIFGSAAVNPSILSSGRPHELMELIETLHNFPGRPIRVIPDVVYGHADNQGLNVMEESFFAGPNMYGQNIDFKNPIVRAMILEMQRRKIDWGFDGVRVDGAQDFKYYDERKNLMIHDDDFLREMSAVEQKVAGVTYRPWMIFEDGRPWPQDDWELASTYREITRRQVHPFQWAAMIFAYNTPYNYTYWVSKWWRLKELFNYGDKWITGYANHDTMRRGTQTDPSSINVNFELGDTRESILGDTRESILGDTRESMLGDTRESMLDDALKFELNGSLKKVMENAYNNPATTLVMNGFLPGVPMDFVQALGHTPWSFIRNTDTTYAIKVAADEAHFTQWQITEIQFRDSRFFGKLKDMGFSSLAGVRRFSKALLNLVKATDYKPENIPQLLNRFEPPFEVTGWSVEKLNQYAAAWTDDVNVYCNVDHHTDVVEPKRAEFNLSVRKFRLQNRWLVNNFSGNDLFRYLEPVNGTVIYYGYRKDSESGKELLVAANMEGRARKVELTKLNLPVDDWIGWKPVLVTPSLNPKQVDQPTELSIMQGILYERTPSE